MKVSLVILVLLSLNFYAQNISLDLSDNEIDNKAFDNKIKKLSDEILKTYKNDDEIKFYDNIFRLYILGGNYEKGLFYLNKLKDSDKYKKLDYREVIGIQFELYALSNLDFEKKSFKDKYESVFYKKINSLSEKSQIYLDDFFVYTDAALKEEIRKIIRTDIVKDSISVLNALKLCRYYVSYIIAKETNKLALPLIKKNDQQQFVVNDSIIIKTKKGNEISLGFVRHRKAQSKLPTILNFSIYNGKKISDNDVEKLYSLKGYVIVNAYSRGVYLSKDNIEPFEFETEDVNEVINWIIKQPWSNGKVGMIGGSYNGFTQWAATKNLHPALKTIIPSASVGFGIDFPMFNNCFSPYMLRWLSYVKKDTDYEIFNDEKKWISTYNTYYKTGVAFNKLDSIYGKTNHVFQKWLKHPSFDSFWQSKIPYKKDFAKINIPILTITGYYDADQRGAIYYYNEHHKYNKNADHYFVIGPYGHGEAVTGVPSEEYKGYKIDSVANIDLKEISFKWFDYILKDQKKPEFLQDKVNYQVMGSNQWKSVETIDKINNKKLKLYLNKTKLQESKPHLDFISQTIDFLKREDTLQNFDDEKILDSIINKADLKDKLVFETDIFNIPFEFNGSFAGELNASINKQDMDLTINIYEKLASGNYFKLNHEYFARASYTKDNTKRKLLHPGKIETIPIQNTFFTSKKIEKGSKLILILGIRKSPDAQINYGSGKDVSEETIDDAKEPLEIKWYNNSYIEIPILER